MKKFSEYLVESEEKQYWAHHNAAIRAADAHLDNKRTEENKDRINHHKEAIRHHHDQRDKAWKTHHQELHPDAMKASRAINRHLQHLKVLTHNPHIAHEKDAPKHPSDFTKTRYAGEGNNKAYYHDTDKYEHEHKKVYDQHMKNHGVKEVHRLRNSKHTNLDKIVAKKKD